MAGTLGSVVLELGADVARLRKDMGRASKVVSRDVKKMQRSAQAARRSLGQIGAGLSFAAIARGIVQATDDFKRYEGQLRLVTKSQAELENTTAAVFRIAQDTRSEFGATANLYARVARSARELNLEQATLEAVTIATNKAIQISGATSQEAAAGAIQFAQGLASGRLQGDELRSILENLPRLAQAVAQGLGVNIGKLRELGKEGALTADAVIAALLSQSETIDREFTQLPVKISDAFTRLRNDVQLALSEIDTKQLIDGIDQFRATLNDPAIRQGLQNFATGVVSAITTATDSIATLSSATSSAGEFWAEFFNGSANTIDRFDDQITDVESDIESLKAALSKPLPLRVATTGLDSLNEIREQIGQLQGELRRLEEARAFAKELEKKRQADLKKTSASAPAQSFDIPDLVGTDKAREKREKAEKRYIEGLERQLALLNDTSAAAKARFDLEQGGLSGADAATRQRIIALSEEIDAVKRREEAEEAMVQSIIDGGDEIAEEQQKRIADVQNVIDATRTPLEQYAKEVQRLSTLGLDDETLERAVGKAQERLKQLQEDARGANDVAKDLGLTFSSAFENAIVNGNKFSDVLKGIGQDIVRILARKVITEPLGDFLSDAFSGLNLFGNAKGGLYKVGGSGSEHPVAFTAKRGEVVAVGTGIEPGGSGGGVVVNVNNSAPNTEATANERTENGRRVIDVMVESSLGSLRNSGRLVNAGMRPAMVGR